MRSTGAGSSSAVTRRHPAAGRRRADRTNTPELYAFLGSRWCPTSIPNHGSLGGIYTGLKAAAGERGVHGPLRHALLASDVVRLVVARAGEADVVVRVWSPARDDARGVREACLPTSRSALIAGRLKITGFFERVASSRSTSLDVARFTDPAVTFMNVNTPEELDARKPSRPGAADVARLRSLVLVHYPRARALFAKLTKVYGKARRWLL